MSRSPRVGLRTAVAVAAAAPLALTLTVGAGAATVPAPELEQPVLESRVTDIIEVDGYEFRDLSKDGELDAYEDWRLPVDERVADLVAQMDLDEKAGLMLIDTLNAACEDGVRGTVPASADNFINTQHMHRFVFRNTVTGEDDAQCGGSGGGFQASTSVTPAEAAGFTNEVQEMSEADRKT